MKLSLEGAQASFISYDRLVISLKGGELYVLTLYADSMRSVRNFHFEKAAASVLTTCVCITLSLVNRLDLALYCQVLYCRSCLSLLCVFFHKQYVWPLCMAF